MTVWPTIVNELQDRYEPAPESDIVAFEEQIGHKLPEDYRDPSGKQLLQYASTMYARERFARYLETFQR